MAKTKNKRQDMEFLSHWNHFSLQASLLEDYHMMLRAGTLRAVDDTFHNTETYTRTHTHILCGGEESLFTLKIHVVREPYTMLHYAKLQYSTTIQYAMLNYTTLCYATLHFTTLHERTCDSEQNVRKSNYWVSFCFPILICLQHIRTLKIQLIN